METYALRLHPHQDLKVELDTWARTHEIEAACVVTCVGSLRRAVLRFANQDQATELEDKFEIVSLTGTLSKYGSHYHLSLADGQGRTLGAHLLEGCLIYTTAEIVLGVLPGLSFLRQVDSATGYEELYIRQHQVSRGER
ncbi:MAG TPA: DNA-binding protein [Anaerolineae bacterium]|nr:DNA-binding protein [Anaerolineae bacterium]